MTYLEIMTETRRRLDEEWTAKGELDADQIGELASTVSDTIEDVGAEGEEDEPSDATEAEGD